jgi:valyl-tRNA synthetase
MHVGDLDSKPEVPAAAGLALVHRWILHRLNAVTGEVKTALETYRFDVAADRLYHFFWDEYADWYIEMVKQHLQAQGEERDTARAVLLEVHDRILRLLHPIIPFVTEELWQKLPRRADDGRTISLARYPEPRDDWADPGSQAEIDLLQDVVTTIRTARAERSVKPSVKITASLEGASPGQQRMLTALRSYVMTLAGLTAFDFSSAAPTGEDVVTRVVGDLRVHIQTPHTDRGAEIEKLRKHHADTVKQIGSIDQKLSNESFVGKAPAQVVEQARKRRQELAIELRKVEDTLRELGA